MRYIRLTSTVSVLALITYAGESLRSYTPNIPEESLHSASQQITVDRRSPPPPSRASAGAQHGHVKDVKDETHKGRGGGTLAAVEGGKPTGTLADRAFDFMDYLVTRGWSPEATAIAVGNAEQESEIFWAGPAGDHGTAHGIVQWRLDRFEALKAFASTRGKPWTDKMVQYEFFANEAEQRLPYWKRQVSLDNLGAISHAYEGYGDASTETRVNNARKWLRAYRERLARATTLPSMLLGNFTRLALAISQMTTIHTAGKSP